MMPAMQRTVVAVLVLAGLGVVVRGQQSGRHLELPDDQPTFRVGTRLATIDAVVVDDKGRHVTDLTPDDFEIVERGKAQTIRQVVYVRTVASPDASVALPALAPPAPVSAPATPPDAPRTRPLAAGASRLTSPERASRVIALVVDDLGLSFESTAAVRRMLTKYVDTRIAPGDLVAIIRTAGGVGALQQFTTDRRLLHAAIDRVRWSLQSRSGVGAFAPVVPDSSTELVHSKGIQPQPATPGPAYGTDIDGLRTEQTTAGTLGALEYVLRGIQTLPGRKAVVFVSEGFDLGIREAKTSRSWYAFERVMDRANRAGVVVYTIDARGLQALGLNAEDDPQTAKMSMPGQAAAGPAEINAKLKKSRDDRTRELFDSQESLVYLAQQTGGFAILNNNDLVGGLGRVIDDTQGYYLLGFDTGIAVNERWDPGDIRVRVKRPGLTVRARRGLFGPADKSLTAEPPPADPLVAAALSPFSTGAIDVRLTTLFAHDGKQGSYVRSLFFIDPAGLTFVDGPEGRKDADVNLLLIGIGDNGLAIAQQRIEVPLRLAPAAYHQLRQRGLLYSARLAIKDPGGYQIRAAVQDMRSQAVGTAAQFVEVPAVGKDRVALSGVVMMDVASLDPARATAATAATLATDAIGDGVLGEPAIKIFRPGSEVVYTCEIYDGRKKRSEGFATRATLIRDGREIFTTPPSPVGAASKDARPVGSVPVGGTLSLGRRLPPGTYTLQVSVGPRAGDRRSAQATQWVDFEVR
jgi:VWFA-related protein